MNEKYMKLDVDQVINALNSITYQFGDEFVDDAELLHDTIAGETNFFEIMNRIYQLKAEAEEAVIGIKSREVDLKARRERLERKSDALKGMMLSLMKTAQQTKVELHEATLSIRKPSKRVEVADVEALPQPYYRIKREAEKAKIKADLEAGLEIVGCSLVDGEEGLTVKRT